MSKHKHHEEECECYKNHKEDEACDCECHENDECECYQYHVPGEDCDCPCHDEDADDEEHDKGCGCGH